MPLRQTLALVLALRLVSILFLKPGGSLIDSLGDLAFYRELGELTLGGRLPYRDFWVEYPPLFPFVLTGLYRLSLYLPGWPSTTAPFQALVSLFLLACDAANVLLVRRIARRIHSPEVADRAALLYALQPFLLLCGLAWFDPFPVTFMLLALDAGLAGSGWLAGLALAFGALAKIIPLAVGPAVLRGLAGRRQIAAAALAGAAATALIVLPILATGSAFARASLEATLNRSSWESLWALLEGYWWVGTVAPTFERLRLEAAGRPLHPPTLPWGAITGANLLVMLLLCVAPAGPRRPRAVVAVGALGLYATLLFSRGYSPQFLVYQLPLLIALWPDRRGVGYTLLLTGLGLLEWPITLSLFPDRRELIAAVIGLRTAVWLWIVVELAAEVWPVVGRRWSLARRPLGWAGGLATAGVLSLTVWQIGALLPERGEHVEMVDYLRTFETDGPVVASSRAAFYRLVPLLGVDRTALGVGVGEPEAPARVRDDPGGDYWVVLDHSEGDPEARARLERDLAQYGSRVTDRWFNYYHLLGFLRPDAWRSDPRLRPTAAVFGDQLALSGWLATRQSVRPGQPVRLVFVWQVLARPAADYKAFVHLLGPAGDAILAQEDRPLDYQGRDAAAWTAGEAPVTALEPVVPADAPAGPLRLRVGVYQPDSGARLPVGGSDHLDLPGPTVVP